MTKKEMQDLTQKIWEMHDLHHDPNAKDQRVLPEIVAIVQSAMASAFTSDERREISHAVWESARLRAWENHPSPIKKSALESYPYIRGCDIAVVSAVQRLEKGMQYWGTRGSPRS